MDPYLIIAQLADYLWGKDPIGHSMQTILQCRFSVGVQPKGGGVRMAMSFGVSDGQLGLANPTHTTQSQHLSGRSSRLRLGQQNRFHFLEFSLSANEETLAHVRS